MNQDAPASTEPFSAWDAYWQDDRGGACQTDDSGRYRGVIATCWREWFATLGANQHVLDLATGNGAVIELAVEGLGADQLPVDFHGVDSARIRPRLGTSPRPGVRCRWYPGVENTSLPFAAGKFDAVTSQYGAEYGDLEATILETARVLKPDRRLLWICHWHDGHIARDAASEARQGRRLQALELPRRIRRLMDKQRQDGRWQADSHRATRDLPEARSVQQGLGQAFSITGTGPGQAEGNLGLYLHNLAHLYQFREQHSLDEVHERFAECERQLRFHIDRLEALVNAALTPERRDTAISAMNNAGLAVGEHGPITEPASGRVVGYRIEAVLD